ncbi:MAG TPA: CoA pyrophosphatase [Acidimicrobiales bacterium]|nr:CoA pyrophosphatase [Acidimicrobiales bacterium]
MPSRDEPGTGGRQRIPRPSDAAPGRPAPWAALPTAARTGLTLAALRGALLAAARSLDVAPPDPIEELTGLDADAASGLRESAVLVAAFEEGGEARVVLTLRAGTLRRHRGEVSFPGGRLDPGEAPLDAALREAHEEVGLEPARVVPVAWLRPIVTFASGSIIRPFVGTLDARPELRAQPDEVERCFDVSLAELLDDGVFHEERWRRPSPRAPSGGTFPIYVFEVAGETVWGATARILTELCSLAVGVALR